MKIWYNNENTVKLPKCDIHKSGGGDLDSKLSVENYKMSSTFSEQTVVVMSTMDVLWQGNLDPTKIRGTILRKQA